MYLFFLRLWYRFTMAWTRRFRPTAIVPRATSVDQIPGWVSHGARWRADPKVSDYLAHPRCFHALVSRDAKLHDCEDHAVYWAVILLKSGLCTRVGIGFVHWIADGGRRDGHAVVVFEDANGKRFWADYHAPVPVSPGPWWSFGGDVVAHYRGVALRKVMYLEITDVKPDDTPVFKGDHLTFGRWFRDA